MTPPLSGMQAIKTLMSEFDSVDSYLQAVHEILAEGHMPDIAGLEARIAHLCAAVQGVTPDIQERCKPKLDVLLQKLDACENDMRAFHEDTTKSANQ